MMTPEQVRKVHIASEKLGLYVAGPVAIYASLSEKLPSWLRLALLASGVGTMIVDAKLLRHYAPARKANNAKPHKATPRMVGPEGGPQRQIPGRNERLSNYVY